MIRNAPLKNYYDEVLKLVPDGSASGQIATIDDGAADCPLKSLKVDIEPIQSGSGTPSPSNVRAISARSEVEVYISPTTTASDGKTYTINLGQSIYGGTLDVGKGELVIDRAEIVPVADTLQSINAHGIANFAFPISQRASNVWADKERAISNILPTQMSLIADTTEAGFTITNATVGYVRLDSTDADTVEEANAWIQTNGLKIVYVLESPTTVSLSPIEIRTLYGINNVWSNSGGETEVTYKADATLLYEKIRNAIIAQGGNV